MASQSSGKISVLLADDHEIYLTGLARIVRKISFIKKIGCAQNADEVLTLLANLSFDIVILDLSMNGMKYLKVVKEIRIKYPSIKIIGFSSVNDSLVFLSFMKEGGNGILLKNTKAVEIEMALGIVVSGNNYFSSSVQDSMKAFSHKENIFSFEKNSFYKNQRMRDLLILICEECTTKQIAEKLRMNEKTVEKYRTELMRITGSKNSAGLVVYAIKNNIYGGGISNKKQLV